MTHVLALDKSQPQGKPAAAGMAVKGAGPCRGDYLENQGILSKKQTTASFSL